MTEPYDSTADTTAHIHRVQELLEALIRRAVVHDQSKLTDPEKAVFDVETPKLRGITYGSPEYKEALQRLGVALEHHYASNSHHPEHHTKGVWGMSLLDLIEMLADWKAATERHADGNMKDSLAINRKRFGIGRQLESVFRNTVKEMGW